MRTFEEVRELLSQKIALERKRLKSYGTKADDFNLANAIARYVMALRSDARHRELKRVLKHYPPDIRRATKQMDLYLQERLKATADMAKANEHLAEKTEKERPWKYKRHKDKHGHKGSSRSRKHRDT